MDTREGKQVPARSAEVPATLAVGGAIASVSGALIPSWSVGYGESKHLLISSLALLLALALSTIVAAVRVQRVSAGIYFTVGAVLGAFALFALTWFLVTPGMVVGLWLMAVALFLCRGFPPARTRLVAVGAVTLVLTTATSIFTSDASAGSFPVYVGTAINLVPTALLLVLSVYEVRRGATSVPG